jgi:DNA-directed RNA polymerase sigma subunit (sigma70/sigma32)
LRRSPRLRIPSEGLGGCEGHPHMDHGRTHHLQEISKVPLLTAGQEVSLAKRVERGDPAAKRQMIEAMAALLPHARRKPPVDTLAWSFERALR